MTMKLTPRGIRLNNPGNIERNATNWKGQSSLQDDPRFIRFDTPSYGLRALMKTLFNYQAIHDLYTVRKMISRWAPPTENPTNSYIDNVARHMGVSPDEAVSLYDKCLIVKMAQAICVQENGHPPEGYPAFWFSPQTYADAADMVLGLTLVKGL